MSQFISLSPIEFHDSHALEAKLDRHQQKSKKNKRNETDRDMSQANTHYTTAHPYNIVTNEGHDRAIFEYHRYVSAISCRMTRSDMYPGLNEGSSTVSAVVPSTQQSTT